VRLTHVVDAMMCSTSQPSRLTLTPTDARDEPPEAEQHPEMAAKAFSAVSTAELRSTGTVDYRRRARGPAARKRDDAT
jgi:hypothetical protein